MKPLFAVLLATGLFCSGLPADTLAVDFVSYAGSQAFDNSIYSLGFEFTVNSPFVAVTRLGVLDLRRDGFQQDQMVGLWDSSGKLLASTAVTSTDALQNLSTADDLSSTAGFRFHAITPLLLMAGQNYRVASQGGEGWVSEPIDPVFGLGITYVQNRWELTGSDATPLVFPTETDGPPPNFPVSYFGANFEYAVPEPATYALLAAGLLLVQLVRRRCR